MQLSWLDGWFVTTVWVRFLHWPRLKFPVAEKPLMNVKLGELSRWITGRDFTPNGVIGALRRGHDRYYNKYINVKRGGIGGIAMLLTGYVLLSYIWEYDHLKHERWRKYH
ncbi:ATP synthase subunit f, mitochondrial-like [Chiloscyllium plagiosum]|uniref:ATP synthase subunit f, mitochondrial-like n=1 Tax=Chiloscyllium plagiosum TaxID=36176 RepID=UPI001CB8477C|nr:ATP synthase subunit f, mitochondrial-like [Chiloscyllium plagiosum]